MLPNAPMTSVIIFGLIAGGCTMGSANSLTANSVSTEAVPYSPSEASAMYAKVVNSEKRVRVIPITADAVSSDGMPWYARVMQPPPPKIMASSRETIAPAARVAERPKKKVEQTRKRDVAERRNQNSVPSRHDPYSAYASAPRGRGFFLFGW